ncbi:MAG TPA: hypothetical protein VHF06_32240 [Pseudonocardiaceae bacterium]|jgi:hypothetical protein|nr:hypothetical protein [Pseudonocardiaceae bacterium]
MALHTDTTSPAKPLTAKRKLAIGRVLATVLFTVVEAWALVVVLAHIRAGGMDRIALALALAGCVVAVIDAWQNIRAQRSTNAESPGEER